MECHTIEKVINEITLNSEECSNNGDNLYDFVDFINLYSAHIVQLSTIKSFRTFLQNSFNNDIDKFYNYVTLYSDYNSIYQKEIKVINKLMSTFEEIKFGKSSFKDMIVLSNMSSYLGKNPISDKVQDA